MKKGINIFLLIAAIINIGVGILYNIFVADALNDYLLYLCIATVIAALCMRGWVETKNESGAVMFGAIIPFVLLYIITGEKNPVFEVFATFLNLLCIRKCMKDMSGAKQPVISGAMTLVALLAEYYVSGLIFCVLSGLTLCAAYAYAVRAAKPANGIIWKIYWVSIFATAFMGLFIMAHGQIVNFVVWRGGSFTEGTYRSMSAAWGYIPVIGLIVLQLAAVLCIFHRASQKEPIRRVAQVCSGAALTLQIAISVFASLAKLPYIGAPLVTVQGMAMTVSAIWIYTFCEFWQNEDISDDGEFDNYDICDE